MSNYDPSDPGPIEMGPPPKKRHHWYRPRNVFLGIVGLVVLIVVIAVATAGGGNTTNKVQAGSAQPAATQPAYSQSAAPTTAAPTTPVPTTPAMTLGEQQAVESAQNYLADGQGFSEAGLLQQLTSSYGEGDTQADAEFAINYLHPDWYQQAVTSAKNYLNDGQGFSKADLYQQLTSSSGEGFTTGQADYALRQVGLG